ncbi:MAG: LamG domain-containing protein [Opitutaceae bacterium]|nr:LamG domain-containing protein [Opitutaceae bacterium]
MPLVSSAAGSASGLDHYIVARWTFNEGTLKPDVGGLELRRVAVGREPTTTFADGAVSLGPGAALVCEEINAAVLPGLTRAVTLWARLRIDAPPAHDNFLFGFRDQEKNTDWKNMTLAVLSRPAPEHATSFFSVLADGSIFSAGKQTLPVEPGRFVSLAVIFDGASGTVTHLVDGRPVSRQKRGATLSLASFSNFAVGRLKTAGAVPMTVDEVRVYSIALSPEWADELEPVK